MILELKKKIVKARRAFNASSGLGIKKNGLTMKTCNIIFWSIVIPIISFGSEIWTMSVNDYELLINFQIHAGRRLQRLPMRSPRGCSFIWLRVDSDFNVYFDQKLLFALTILKMDLASYIRKLFCLRVNDFVLYEGWENPNRSAVLEIIFAAKRLGLLNILVDMVNDNITVFGKRQWSKVVWGKAWILEDIFWDSTKLIHKENDLMYRTISRARYMAWWRVSYNPDGGTQVQRGAAPALRISRKKGSFLRPPHVRDFVKEGYFFVPRYEVLV